MRIIGHVKPFYACRTPVAQPSFHDAGPRFKSSGNIWQKAGHFQPVAVSAFEPHGLAINPITAKPAIDCESATPGAAAVAKRLACLFSLFQLTASVARAGGRVAIKLVNGHGPAVNAVAWHIS